MPKKGAKRRLAFIFLLAIWLLKAVLGLIAAIGQKATSYPDAVRGFPSPYLSDFEFYVVVPAAFALLNLLMSVFANRLLRWLAMLVAAMQVFLLLALVLFGTGGV